MVSVPARLRPNFYFDLDAHPFAHGELLASAATVSEVLDRIGLYVTSFLARSQQLDAEPHSLEGLPKIVGARDLVEARVMGDAAAGLDFQPDVVVTAKQGSPPGVLFLGAGVDVQGGTLDVREGSIWLGAGTIVEPGVTVKGPAIFGPGCVLRSGAYVRGNVVFGSHCVLRCESKNVVVMDQAELCHPGYIGDSILGFKAHFGCQALTANLGLHGAGSVKIQLDDGSVVDLGRRKFGAVLGDHCQLGCNSVTEPGVLMGPRTVVYPLTRLAKGVYGPDELIKNRPAIERVPLRPPGPAKQAQQPPAQPPE